MRLEIRDAPENARHWLIVSQPHFWSPEQYSSTTMMRTKIRQSVQSLIKFSRAITLLSPFVCCTYLSNHTSTENIHRVETSKALSEHACTKRNHLSQNLHGHTVRIHEPSEKTNPVTYISTHTLSGTARKNEMGDSLVEESEGSSLPRRAGRCE